MIEPYIPALIDVWVGTCVVFAISSILLNYIKDLFVECTFKLSGWLTIVTGTFVGVCTMANVGSIGFADGLVMCVIIVFVLICLELERLR